MLHYRAQEEKKAKLRALNSWLKARPGQRNRTPMEALTEFLIFMSQAED